MVDKEAVETSIELIDRYLKVIKRDISNNKFELVKYNIKPIRKGLNLLEAAIKWFFFSTKNRV